MLITMSDHTIKVREGLTPADVLVYLYQNAKVQNRNTPADFIAWAHLMEGIHESEEKKHAEKHLERDKYVDYYKGIAIKTDFSTFPELYLRLYCRDQGNVDFRPITATTN